MHSFCIALIPVYQPTEQLIFLVNEAKSRGFQIVVIDDGNSTGTNDMFASTARFGTGLRHVENMSRGNATKTGLSFIQSQYPAYCTVVTLDADGQHRVADAPKICKMAQNHPNTIALGSRKLKENVPPQKPVWEYGDQTCLILIP